MRTLMIPSGLRSPTKQRERAWWTVAISTFALVFAATALGAGTSSAQPTLTTHRPIETSPVDAASGHEGTVLALGSGYRSPGGSPLVRALQGDLDSAGYPSGGTDGHFGPRTQQAVVAFQAAHGLRPDGLVGPRTWAVLSASVLVLRPGAGAQLGGSNVVRAPQPGSLARKAPSAASHRRGSAALPWMTILGGLALAVALILAGPLLIAALRRAPRRDDDGAPAMTAASSTARSSVSTQMLVTMANGYSKGIVRTNDAQTHTNGQDGAANVAGGGDGAEGLPVRSEPEALADSEEAVGAFNLGLLLEAHGSLVEAQAAYGRADDRGHGAAASNLGRLLEQQGKLSEAEAAYRRADQRGDPEGAFNLGVLLEERDDRDEAAAAYRRAVDWGHDAAASNLGVLLEELGALDEAEAAYRRADDRDDAVAAFNLGVLLEERGALTDAEEAYRRAERRGERDIANMARAALLNLSGNGLRTGADRAPQQQDA